MEVDKSKILTTFEGRDLGPISSFLGINVVHDRDSRTIMLDQTSAIKKLLVDYGMDDAKGKAVPMEPGLKLSQEGEPMDAAGTPYANLIDSLMYLAVSTRPDIAFSVSTLARFMSKPTDAAMAAAKGLLRYLSVTADLKLTFSGSGNYRQLSIYTDSDFGACLDTRKSVSGFVITLNGGAIAWHSKKQSTVALSTTEAEYMASAAAIREVLWFRTLPIAWTWASLASSSTPTIRA